MIKNRCHFRFKWYLLGSTKPILVTLGGLIQIFRKASPTFSYGSAPSPPPGFQHVILMLFVLCHVIISFIIWLAPRAGKMELSCPLGTTRRVPQEKFPRKPYNKSFIDQACLVKMAGYWPRSFFASLWTSTPSRSINSQKKNLVNIQPS